MGDRFWRQQKEESERRMEIIDAANAQYPHGGRGWLIVAHKTADAKGYVVTSSCTCKGHDGSRGHDPLCGYQTASVSAEDANLAIS